MDILFIQKSAKLTNNGAQLYLVFGEILLDVLVEETNLEDNIGVGNTVGHVEITQRVTQQDNVLPPLKLRVMDGALRLNNKRLHQCCGAKAESRHFLGRILLHL